MQISTDTIDIVKSTIPLLEENGVKLTKHFYARMFEQNPEVKPFFNPAHQDGSQQAALAGAIVAFARNIDNLPALKEAVRVISNKHASLMIQPEHYPIVGENLLAAISTILGGAATEEVMDAWAIAYDLLANILITAEADIYKQQSKQENGWNGFRLFRVAKRTVESSEITSLYLTPVDNDPIPFFEAGQFLTVRLPYASGKTTMRNYSLSSPHNENFLRISVKAEKGIEGQPDGMVSNLLHTAYNIGDEIEVGPPCGHFTIQDHLYTERPLVFLAGGVGITPLISMTKAVLEKSAARHITFFHACRSYEAQAFSHELTKLAANHPTLDLHFIYEKTLDQNTMKGARIHDGRISNDLLAAHVRTSNPVYYFCGPPAFMTAVQSLLDARGIAAEDINFEFFGPQQ